MKLKLTFLALWATVLGLHLSLSAQTQSLMNGVTLDKHLVKTLENADVDQDIRVIVTFSDAKIARQGRELLSQYGGAFTGPEFMVLPLQGVYANPSEIYAFTEIDGVLGIWQDRPNQTEMKQAVIVSSVKDTWEDTEFTVLNDGLPVLGRGVGVLVNDSGFDGDDTDLEDGIRIVQNVKGTGTDTWIEDNGPDNDQSGGHGTHCLGIVGGDGSHSNGKIVGVAPKAQLLGYGSNGGLLILDTAGGFEYTARHAKDYNIRVMSNSFGPLSDDITEYEPNHPLNIATKVLADMGIVVVFSAGNDGPEDGTITGNYKTAPWVITVSNGTKAGGLANSSSRGKPDPNGSHPSQRADITVDGVDYLWENRPTVTAPGTQIVSVRATASALQGTSVLADAGADLEPNEVPFYTVLSGTSMACPHVAGIVALMMEANPKLDWRACKAIIQRTAIGSMPGVIHERGTGYVNAHAAVAAAFHGLCAAPEGAAYEQLYGLNADQSFGFDTDAWKTCPLNSEVAERLKVVVPDIGAEAQCGANSPTVLDSAGETPTAAKDILSVAFTNETATTFDVVLTVAEGLDDVVANVPDVLTNYWDVHFTLDKTSSAEGTANTPVNYIISSYKEVTGNQFILTVKSNQSNTRPSTEDEYRDVITGAWTDNTITWTVDKSLMNYKSMPSTPFVTDADRTGPAPNTADMLSSWKAFTYTRPGLTTPDGAGNYDDSAEGDCFKTFAE